MINKNQAGIKCIHKLIIEGRRMSYNPNIKNLPQFLDALEYLPALMLEEADRSDLFRNYLKDICDDFKLPLIYREYLENE
jgi:hypothetical protein